MAQPLNVLTSCHGNSSSNSRRRTGFHGCARCKKPTMSLEHLSSQTCIRTLERQLMVSWLYRCLKTKGTMWAANNAQYYSTIHSLRLTSIQAVPDVWLGTESADFSSGFATCLVRYVRVRYMFATNMPNSLLTLFCHPTTTILWNEHLVLKEKLKQWINRGSEFSMLVVNM